MVSGVSPAAGRGATSLINNRKFRNDFSYEVLIVLVHRPRTRPRESEVLGIEINSRTRTRDEDDLAKLRFCSSIY